MEQEGLRQTGALSSLRNTLETQPAVQFAIGARAWLCFHSGADVAAKTARGGLVDILRHLQRRIQDGEVVVSGLIPTTFYARIDQARGGSSWELFGTTGQPGT